MLLAGSALLGSGLLAACGQDGEDAAPSSSEPASSAPTSAAPAAPAGPPPAGDPVAWPDVARVPHLFFHSLVVDPARAFDGDDKAGGYLDFMVTECEAQEDPVCSSAMAAGSSGITAVVAELEGGEGALVDRYGDIAVVELSSSPTGPESAAASTMVVLVWTDEKWLVRDAYRVADQPK